MARGRFITFEGIDGAGKSTVMAGVAAALRAAGHRVVTTREETQTYLGEAVRRSIREGAPPETTALLFVADRMAHGRDIEAALGSGRDVLCDRYLHSTLAYQAAAGCDAQWLLGLHARLQVQPDRVLLFDVDPEVAMARVEARGQTAPYEKVDFLARVRAEYLRIAARDDRVIVIDAAQGPAAVLDAARDAVTTASSSAST